MPKKEIRKAIRYALSVTLQEYRSEGKLMLCEWVFMSNHYHLLGLDHDACLPDFIRDLNSLLSRQLNALRGISGANIEKGYNLVEIQSAERFVEHAVYTLANPVRAFLVATTKDWEDMSSFGMQYGRPVTVERPTSGLWAGKVAHRSRRASRRSGRAKYSGRSKMPETAELVIDRPPVMTHLTDEQLREHILGLLAVKEREYKRERKERGIQVMGWGRVVAQNFLAIPKKTEELFSRVPCFSATDKEERVAAAKLRQRFLDAYYAARDAFISGVRDVVFPAGTWLMRVRFNCACEPWQAAGATA